MGIKLMSEEDLLSQGFRKAIIDEINGPENQQRKQDMYRRYEIYKDYTKKYVLSTIEREQGRAAVEEIKYRVSNISICKSIINKKAMLYANGVKREVVGDEVAQQQIDQVVDILNMNSIMRKANRYEELFKNAIIQIYPYVCDKSGKWKIKLNVLAPYKVDVIESYNNPEEARAYILSYFTRANMGSITYPEGLSAVHPSTAQGSDFRSGDGINQGIANAPIDEGSECLNYIWWSNNYHFTTDEKGLIIPGKQEDNLANSIGDSSFVNIAIDQDGSFWSLGGEDIIDGAILINLFLTELYYIAKYQGMGLFYMFGRGVPKSIKVGPSQAITLDVQPEDPTPQIGFASSNPPLNDYMAAIKEYISALLKTNKLEPSTVIGMDSAVKAASGIQELLQKSDLMEDQEDKKEVYRDKEPEIFEAYIKWHNLLFDRGLLDDNFAEIGRINEDIKINLKFNPPQTVQTELEKLDIIQRRRDLSLDTLMDSIQRDNPELTKEEAEEKMLDTLKRKALEARSKAMNGMMPYSPIGDQKLNKDESMPEEMPDDDDMMKEDEMIKD